MIAYVPNYNTRLCTKYNYMTTNVKDVTIRNCLKDKYKSIHTIKKLIKKIYVICYN